MKIVIVLPAYNCSKTLSDTIAEIPQNIADEIVLVDDCSIDDTCQVAKQMGLNVIRHDENLGYGANQKTCYSYALSQKADVVIMLHPDYQYDPKLITQMVELIRSGAKIVFGSRMLHGWSAVKNGMPVYKYIANRMLTILQNVCLRKRLSEYHTGYRAYCSDVLEAIDYKKLSNDFIFDNQIILEAFKLGYNVEEIYCPARYLNSSSSINFTRSLKYGLGVVYNTFKYLFK